ncbi:hypothetical protein DPMN_081673 [Dreissena polymorpha]|uniref:Uncharacterized protein n=1 Tax=Dreissena polymorpha TaxID=45954 RepID=A0A9D3Y5F5_DREPO|nr:hypothetical protein DPMN_081673 [Dreissena polymorpha]
MGAEKLKALFPDAFVLALTATATKALQKQIARELQLREPNLITTSIDRPNIKFEVKRRPSVTSGTNVEKTYDFIFGDVLKELNEKLDNYPKTTIYTKLKWCGYGYEEVTRPSIDDELNQSLLQQFVAQLVPVQPK